ncbi:unnamed protein product [Lampetra planeri]
MGTTEENERPPTDWGFDSKSWTLERRVGGRELNRMRKEEVGRGESAKNVVDGALYHPPWFGGGTRRTLNHKNNNKNGGVQGFRGPGGPGGSYRSRSGRSKRGDDGDSTGEQEAAAPPVYISQRSFAGGSGDDSHSAGSPHQLLLLLLQSWFGQRMRLRGCGSRSFVGERSQGFVGSSASMAPSRGGVQARRTKRKQQQRQQQQQTTKTARRRGPERPLASLESRGVQRVRPF